MKKIMFYGIYFISPILMFRVLYGINPEKYSQINMLLAMLFGIAAYNWFVWQFVLSARPKFLDMIIGLDKIYKLHGIMALVSIGLALSHRVILDKIYGNSLLTNLGRMAVYIYIGISILSVLFLTKQRWINLKFIVKIKKLIGKRHRFKYEHFKLLHNLTIVALLVMQIHVLLTKSARTYNTVFIMYMGYFVVAVVFYTYHKVLRPWLVKENLWVVDQVLAISENVWRIKMVSKTHQIKYKPGQFAFFKIKVNDHYELHPFSFISSPHDKGELSIAVKALGDFSGHISQLKNGDTIYLDGPYGDFSYLKYPKEKKTVFIAGGVGITPVLSMLKHMSQVDMNRQVTLIWGIRNEKDMLFKNEFDRLMEAMPNLKIVPVVSGDKNYEGEKGYIDFDKLLKYIGPNQLNDTRTGYYICGPAMLMKNSISYLYDLGIQSLKIHYEAFTF